MTTLVLLCLAVVVPTLAYPGGYYKSAYAAPQSPSYQPVQALPVYQAQASYLNPLQCVYSDWNPWSPCSAACGVTGFSSRSRMILYDPPSKLVAYASYGGGYGGGYGGYGGGLAAVGGGYGGGYGASSGGYGAAYAAPAPKIEIKLCDQSSLEEWRDCLGEPCDADCMMTEWTEWGVCSAQCGPGIQARSREVMSLPVGSGEACGFTDQTTDCNNGPCAQDCVLGDWGQWSSCPACGPGSRTRQRSIVQQGAFGGQICDIFRLTESEACFNTPCAQDCVMDQWTAWSQCSSQCGPGRRDRYRSVRVEAAYGGNQCGPSSEYESCDSGPCARDCVVGDWGYWSSCPSCGEASRTRQRSVIEQAAFGGRQCDFSQMSETESCNLPSCAVDCQMSSWSDWSECSADCGEGRRQRIRTIITYASNGGRSCGTTEEWSSCDSGPCARDCVLGDWSDWSGCPSCGEASRNRQRSILVEAAFGGRQCYGSMSETESCNLPSCAVDCVMEDWSDWTQCSSQCGAGRRDRYRSILVNAANGGRSCGPTSEYESCDNGPCVRDCVMGFWTEWSNCCDAGVRTRWREISEQPSGPGARPCGDVEETEKCTPARYPPVIQRTPSYGSPSSPSAPSYRKASSPSSYGSSNDAPKLTFIPPPSSPSNYRSSSRPAAPTRSSPSSYSSRNPFQPSFPVARAPVITYG